MRIPEAKDECLIEHHPADSNRRSEALGRLGLAFLVGLGFIALEVAGAFLSGSLALLADAFHMLADSLALGFGLLAAVLASRPLNQRRSYGYYRLEVLAALFNGLLLFGMATFLIFEAFERWKTPAPIEGFPMLIVAILGLAANLFMLSLLHPGREHSLNMRGVFLHVLGDTLSSVAVIVGAAVVLYTGSTWPDLLASLFVSVMISLMAVKLVWDSAHVLMESTPKQLKPVEVQERMFNQFPQILNIHDFHIWEISNGIFTMTAHLEVNLESLGDGHRLIENLNQLLKNEFQITHSTFQLEPSARSAGTET